LMSFSGQYAFTAGDLNGDGRTDLVMTYPSGSALQVAVALGAGDGFFGEPQPLGSLQLISGVNSLALATLGPTSLLDVIVSDFQANEVSVLLHPCGAKGVAPLTCIPPRQPCTSGGSPCCSLGSCVAGECP
jgi:hypothetical protein